MCAKDASPEVSANEERIPPEEASGGEGGAGGKEEHIDFGRGAV